jgi:hypothetical protein
MIMFMIWLCMSDAMMISLFYYDDEFLLKCMLM